MRDPHLESIRSRLGPKGILLPGVWAFLLHAQGKALLRHGTDPGCSVLPSGAEELDETVLEVQKRAAGEEITLEVHHAEPPAPCSGPGRCFKYPTGDESRRFPLAFIARDGAGMAQADGIEGSEVRFRPLDALPENLLALHAHRTPDDFRRHIGGFIPPGNAIIR